MQSTLYQLAELVGTIIAKRWLKQKQWDNNCGKSDDDNQALIGQRRNDPKTAQEEADHQ